MQRSKERTFKSCTISIKRRSYVGGYINIVGESVRNNRQSKVNRTLVQALGLSEDIQLYSFLTTALEGGEGSASRPGRQSKVKTIIFFGF